MAMATRVVRMARLTNPSLKSGQNAISGDRGWLSELAKKSQFPSKFLTEYKV